MVHRFHPEVVAKNSDLLREHLHPISTEGLVDRLYADDDPLPPETHRVYAETVTDLGALLDEIRFSAALASLYIDDYLAHIDPAESPSTPSHADAGIPIEVMATLHAYFAPLPEPITLIESPHTKMTGNRVLSLWFAGQLLDAALVRLVAILDRHAILLWCASGLPLERRHGRLHRPAFRTHYLAQMEGRFSAVPWKQFSDLTAHPLFGFLLEARDDFTHSIRKFSELHGHYRVAYNVRGDLDQIEVTEAMDRGTHLAIVLAAYNEILSPAMDAARQCLQTDTNSET